MDSKILATSPLNPSLCHSEQPLCLFSYFLQLLSFRISCSHPFLRGHLPPFGLSCLQPWLLWDVPDPRTLSKQRWACTRGPHLLTSPTSHFSHRSFQCSAAAHAADDPAFGRKWKLTGTRGSGAVAGAAAPSWCCQGSQ